MPKYSQTTFVFLKFVTPFILLLLLILAAMEFNTRVGKLEVFCLDAGIAWERLRSMSADRFHTCRLTDDGDTERWRGAVAEYDQRMTALDRAFWLRFSDSVTKETINDTLLAWEKCRLDLDRLESGRTEWLAANRPRPDMGDADYRQWLAAELRGDYTQFKKNGETVVHDLRKASRAAHATQSSRGWVIVGLGLIGLLVLLWTVYRYLAAARREREAALEELKKGEGSLRIILNSIGDGVIAVDVNGHILQMNPVAEKMTGHSGDKAKGRLLGDILKMVDIIHREPLGFLNDGEKDDAAERNIEAVLVSGEGEETHVALNRAPILDSNQHVVGTVFALRDISQEHELQRQLRQAQKMEAVGTLAGGVAHDFNNLLAGILGNAQLIEAGMGPDNPDAGCVADLIKSAERAADLTRKLLDFSHKGTPVMAVVDTHALVDEVIHVLEHSVGDSIVVKRDLMTGSPHMRGDANQLQNAVLNLCLNARDAMPDGGTITLATALVKVDGRMFISPMNQLAPGTYVKISVTDTGVGIPFGLREKIFEPFFTTKAKGKGTGLGLASVYACVVEHKGAIQIESDEGDGTVFSVFLPATDDVTDDKRSGKAGESMRGEGHILIVDDEDVVRKFGARALEALGYQVSTASDGLEGVITFHKLGDQIDLVLLDIVMPKMDGVAAFKRMRELNPKIPILLCSGFSRPAALDDMLAQGAAGFIAKPYRIDQLSREVHRIINRDAAAAE
ncbi:MAG: response regulator [Lentisphaeria bacterium]|nr:response regulator [Lentisphaeria bacterium]